MAWSIFSNPGGGVTPASWARSLLRAVGAPQTPANVQSVIAWEIHEGGGGTYNPLNTTEPGPGASSLNSVGVKNYTSYQEGIAETARTLQGGYYTSILDALRSGKGLGTGSYPGLSTWSGGGYSNMAGTWNEAAHYMSGKGTIIKGGGYSTMSATTTGSTSGPDASLAASAGNVLSAGSGMLHGAAVMLDRFFALGAPGQGWRFVFGAGMAGGGYASYRAFTSGDDGDGNLPLAIAFAGVAALCAFMTFRPWPQAGGKAIKPGAYLVDVLRGEPPPAGPSSLSSSEVDLTETALGGMLGLWAAAKVAQGISAGSGAVSSIMNGILGYKALTSGGETAPSDVTPPETVPVPDVVG